METVQVSDRYRVTIPESIRRELALKVGDELLLERVAEGTYRFRVIEKSAKYHERLLQLLKTPPRRTEEPREVSPEEMRRLEEPEV